MRLKPGASRFVLAWLPPTPLENDAPDHDALQRLLGRPGGAPAQAMAGLLLQVLELPCSVPWQED